MVLQQKKSAPPPVKRTGNNTQAYDFDAGSPVKLGNQDDPDWLGTPIGKKVCSTNLSCLFVYLYC